MPHEDTEFIEISDSQAKKLKVGQAVTVTIKGKVKGVRASTEFEGMDGTLTDSGFVEIEVKTSKVVTESEQMATLLEGEADAD